MFCSGLCWFDILVCFGVCLCFVFGGFLLSGSWWIADDVLSGYVGWSVVDYGAVVWFCYLFVVGSCDCGLVWF